MTEDERKQMDEILVHQAKILDQMMKSRELVKQLANGDISYYHAVQIAKEIVSSCVEDTTST